MIVSALKRALSSIILSGKRTFSVMCEKDERDYKEVINMLNGLQTNANVLKKALDPPVLSALNAKLDLTRKFIYRSGLTPDDIDRLPVLHVSGTKGKGSTCAFCESILRHHGYKTGFFSSPHLVEVRERIRINGKPIAKSMFSTVFKTVYQRLDEEKENSSDLPFYFQFLFIMAVHIFLRQKVDVAVIEVGIGGAFDPTNIVTNVHVAGITSLGLDHTAVLGNTIESIAWNKAGIAKKNTKLFTVPQPPSALTVLKERSKELQSDLTVVEKECYIPVMRNYPASIQTNISLALKMSEAWMSESPLPSGTSTLDKNLLKISMEGCKWPGRYESGQYKKIRYYIDGAHTTESMAVCLKWYMKEVRNRTEKRALVFNLTGGRSFREFKMLLSECQFDLVIFTPNVSKPQNACSDNLSLTSPLSEQLRLCNSFKDEWSKTSNSNETILVFSSVQEALDYMDFSGPYNLLITGSLYLVGAAMEIIDPTLSGSL